ncbi:MAG: asparagine synthase (glutamine-hydrolyzing) [Steroidobacteraceae bacterium]
MCGIAGIVELRGAPVEDTALDRLTTLISHRGPDGVGMWISADRSVAFGHRRLAIIDPGEGGRQPMLSQDGRDVIIYNGEIYNFLELRRELEIAGWGFRTESDTEVILAAWRTWREDMLVRFNGMWSMAIFDTHSREVFLARDRFGIKPLLFSSTPERVVFASEMRAILRSGLVSANLDPDVARRLVLDPFGVEGSSRTLFNPVQRLQAGHLLNIRGGRIEVKRWWRTTDHLPSVPTTEQDQIGQFGALFRDAVALRMRSDVPIGTSLSGGFDSSAILCTMAEVERAGIGPRAAQEWRHAFVASFPGMPNDELPDAQTAANWAGVKPIVIEIGRDKALEDIDRVMDDLDDVYIGLPTAVWHVYRELRRHRVLVSLDGHGADELMGAYSQEGRAWNLWWRNLVARWASVQSGVTSAFDFARAATLQHRGLLFLRGGSRRLPPLLALVGDGDHLPEAWGSLNRRLYRMFHSNVLPTILRNFDRLSMAHGIEVRMPFMDWRLVTYTMSLPDASKRADGHTKMVARRAMAGRMPETIRMRARKVGFNSPMPEWLNGPLVDWTSALLHQSVPAFDELFDAARLAQTVSRLVSRQAWDWESASRIWPYLNLKWLLARS